MHGQQPRHREPAFNAPTIVLVLIALLIMVHAGRQWLSSHDDALVIVLLAFIPARLTEAGAGLAGGLAAGLTSTLTHALLHADWLHLTLNGAWLLAFGTLIARRCSVLAFLALFALSAIGGALLFFVMHPGDMVPLVGASGAISGLMGAAFRVIFVAIDAGAGQILRQHPRAVPRMPLGAALRDRSTMTAVALWLGINLIFGLGLAEMFTTGEIAWEAHVGGFLVGFLLFGLFDGGRTFRDLENNAASH